MHAAQFLYGLSLLQGCLPSRHVIYCQIVMRRGCSKSAQQLMLCFCLECELLFTGGCSTESQINPYYISNTTSVCDLGATNAPLPNLPTAGTAYECPSWKLNSGPLWMGLGCLAMMSILMSRSFKVTCSASSVSENTKLDAPLPGPTGCA